MRAFIGFVAAAFLMLSPTAQASTYSTDITDVWWNAAEPGWGVNVILQNNYAFMTFFIYDPARNPVWYTAQLIASSGFVWTGGLYATNGPYFGGPFPPTATIRQAGTATFNVTTINAATLTYTVDGVTVVKNLTRQLLAIENYSGTYAGGYSLRNFSCNPELASFNGIHEVSGLLTISQVGNSVTMISTSATVGTCTFGGTYAQTGKLGEIIGNYSCSDGTLGTFDIFDMTPTISGFTSRAIGQNQYCQWSGYVGGIARAQ